MSVIDFASNGNAPPEGERGTVAPHGVSGDGYWPGFNLFGAYDQWTGRLNKEPTVRDLENMLDRDGKAAALEQVLTLPLRWADLQIHPAEGDQGEAQLVTEALLTPPHEGGMSTPLDHVIAQMTAAVWQRRAFFEKCWRPEADRWTYKKLAHRPCSSCQIKRHKHTGDFEGFKQQVGWDYPGADQDGWITIEADNALVYVHDQARAPLNGRSALTTAYHAFEAKQKIRFLWFSFLARYGEPWGVATDDTNDQGNASALARKAAQLKGGGFIGLHAGQSVDLLETSSDGGGFQKCMDWLSSEMSQSVLAGFTDLASAAAAGRGSLALSQDASDFFLRACEARQSEMAATLTIYCASDLVKWNFGASGKTPTIKFSKLSDERASEAKELFEAMIGSAVPDPRIPAEFFDTILEKVAATLGPKEADVIHRAIQAQKDRTPVERVHAVASQAAQMVQDAGLTA